jgi:hypothetical protein
MSTSARARDWYDLLVSPPKTELFYQLIKKSINRLKTISKTLNADHQQNADHMPRTVCRAIYTRDVATVRYTRMYHKNRTFGNFTSPGWKDEHWFQFLTKFCLHIKHTAKNYDSWQNQQLRQRKWKYNWKIAITTTKVNARWHLDSQ